MHEDRRVDLALHLLQLFHLVACYVHNHSYGDDCDEYEKLEDH